MAKNDKEIKEKKQKNGYFKEMKAELKKVVWPTPKELANNTIAVIMFVLIIGIVVFIFDFCFDNLNKYGITRLQEAVKSSFETSNETTEENNTENQNEQADDSNTNEENSSEENNEENQNNESAVEGGEEQNSTEEENKSTEQNNTENNSAESNQ